MRRPARDPGEAMITVAVRAPDARGGTLARPGVLSAYGVTVWLHGEGLRANTVAFLAVVLIHPLQAMNCRSERVRWWRLPPNPWIWAALAALVFAQWCAIYWAPLPRVLGTVPLATSDWIVLDSCRALAHCHPRVTQRSAPEPGRGIASSSIRSPAAARIEARDSFAERPIRGKARTPWARTPSRTVAMLARCTQDLRLSP